MARKQSGQSKIENGVKKPFTWNQCYFPWDKLLFAVLLGLILTTKYTLEWEKRHYCDNEPASITPLCLNITRTNTVLLEMKQQAKSLEEQLRNISQHTEQWEKSRPSPNIDVLKCIVQNVVWIWYGTCIFVGVIFLLRVVDTFDYYMAYRKRNCT